MEVKVYSIKDAKAGYFHSPIFANNPAQAQRTFHSIVNDPQSPISKYPEDYSLWQLGVWDNVTGFIKGQEPSHLCTAMDVVSTKGLQS